MKKILYLLLAAMALAGCTKTYTVPTVVTDPSPEVDAQHNNAVIHGTVTDDGGLEILEGGFYWGTDWDCDNRLVFAYPGNNLSHTLTGLTNGKTYYYRAYAKNKLGEASSETQHFVFHGLTVPSVTTGTYSVSGTTATCSGSATTQSGAPLTQAGICYRAGSGTPTLSNNVRYASGVNGNTSLSFSCQITGLSAGTFRHQLGRHQLRRHQDLHHQRWGWRHRDLPDNLQRQHLDPSSRQFLQLHFRWLHGY